ncbi:MAG: ABC transporter permease [Coriobacteriales bacterium]|nr:ABC transporter permease [Coriobacteriales bacterium]
MKKTQVIDLFANIRATFVSFFSIAMFVALGVSVFLGLQWGAKALARDYDAQMAQGKYHDIEVMLPTGMFSDTIEKLRALDGVEDVESYLVSYQELANDSNHETIKVQSLSNKMDVPVVLEGSLPQADGEIALLANWAQAHGIQVGDTITLAHDGPSRDTPMLFLKKDSYRVTGLVDYAGCLARNSATYGFAPKGSGSVSCIAFVPESSFAAQSYLGAYPVVGIRCKDTQGLSAFSEEYRNKVQPVADAIHALGEKVVPTNNEYTQQVIDMLGDALDQIDTVQNSEESRSMRDSFAKQRGQVEGLMLDDWIVTTRAGNGGVTLAQMFEDVLGRLRFSMASLFLIVGLLVCYSAIARIVNEQVVQIGTKKALGLFEREVTLSYLLYAALAVVAGVIVGVLAAVFIVQRILNPAISGPFVLGTVKPYWSVADAGFSLLTELVLILVATWFSCHGVLKRRAVELLAGPEPPSAKAHFYESWGIWKRLPLLYQVVVNNCVNDKRRVIGTIVGVAGCTSLVVCALTLNNNVLNSFDKQYQGVYGFNVTARLAASAQRDAKGVASKVHELGYDCTPVTKRTLALEETGGSMAAATLFVPADEESFGTLYHMHDVSGGDVDLKGDGAWISAGFAKDSGKQVGDKVGVLDSSGKRREVEVLGYFDFYLMNVDMVMGKGAYQTAFEAKPVPNTLLVSTSEEYGTARERLLSVKGIEDVTDDKARALGSFGQFRKISQTVVLVYVCLAAVMAVVVLLNLNVMYIEEKRRELTVLMICGFTVRQAKGYVRYDSIALTIIGIVLGIVLGTVVGLASVTAIEPTNVLFLHEVNLPACAIGAGVCAVFALVVGYIAFRRIPKFDLTDINRF